MKKLSILLTAFYLIFPLILNAAHSPAGERFEQNIEVWGITSGQDEIVLCRNNKLIHRHRPSYFSLNYVMPDIHVYIGDTEIAGGEWKAAPLNAEQLPLTGSLERVFELPKESIDLSSTYDVIGLVPIIKDSGVEMGDVRFSGEPLVTYTLKGTDKVKEYHFLIHLIGVNGEL